MTEVHIDLPYPTLLQSIAIPGPLPCDQIRVHLVDGSSFAYLINATSEWVSGTWSGPAMVTGITITFPEDSLPPDPVVSPSRFVVVGTVPETKGPTDHKTNVVPTKTRIEVALEEIE